MSETYIVRGPSVLNCRFKGITDPLAWTAETVYDLGSPVAYAQVTFPRQPSVTEGDWMELDLGPDDAGAYTRFAGYVVRVQPQLWGTGWRVIGNGTLILVERTKVDAIANPTGIDLSNGGVGQTDQAMVTQILNTCGVKNYTVNGTGIVFGTVAIDQFIWTPRQSGLAFVQELDDITGYRTFNTPAGGVMRMAITPTPASTPAYTFTEGVDIEQADLDEQILQVINEWTVTGYNDGTAFGAVTYTAKQDSPFLLGSQQLMADQYDNAKIERALDSDPGKGISCQTVAVRKVQETNRKLQVITFTTPRAERYAPGMTIAVTSPFLNVTNNYWVRSVRTQIDEQRKFSQQLQVYGGPGSGAPVTGLPPLADFTMKVEVETVVVVGAETTLYVVTCSDASYAQAGTIASWAWTATGGTPASGTDSSFTTAYTDLTGKSITLTVTDSNGLTGTITKTITDTVPTNQQLQREIYEAANVKGGDFYNAAWKVFVPPAGSVTVVANGPLWAAGSWLIRSTDHGATTLTSQPFGAATNITSIWDETDVNASNILIGGSDGRVGYSTDGGATFTILSGPSSSAVKRCIISRYVQGQFHVLTASAWYISDNYGLGWRTVRSAAAGQTFRDLVLSNTRNVICSQITSAGAALERAEDGTAFTFPISVTDVYAVAGHISEDKFYCVDSAGHTYYTTTPGGTAMTQGANLPDATQPQIQGIKADGAFVDLVYFGNGTNGLWKTVDGFKANNYQVRKPGVGNSDAAANYKMVGVDGVLKTRKITPFTLDSTVGQGKMLWLGSSAEPFGWQNSSFNDSGWTTTITDTFDENASGRPVGANAAWVTIGIPSATGYFLFRESFNLGSGAISTAQIKIICNDNYNAIWLNNTVIDAQPPTSAVKTITINPAVLVPGRSNLLAIKANNNSVADTDIGIEFELTVS